MLFGVRFHTGIHYGLLALSKSRRSNRGLSSRAPESLARFIASLAVDIGLDTDSLNEHVQTFIVGDNLAEATESLK